MVYNQSLSDIARHALIVGLINQRRIDPNHLPPRDHEDQMESLRHRYAALDEIAVEFLAELLGKTRYSKHHAQKVSTLLNVYPKGDVLAAMRRAVTFLAFAYSALERSNSCFCLAAMACLSVAIRSVCLISSSMDQPTILRE